MKQSELEPGDVIFTAMGRKMMHTQIYTGGSHFDHTILHPVNEGQHSKLMATSLRPTGDYVVFRCKRPVLTTEAVRLARHWVQYETTFDTARSSLKSAWNTQKSVLEGMEDATDEMSRLFRKQGIFRAIKYAARRNRPLCHPGEDEEAKNGTGLTCTMYVIICFQAAGLQPHVNTVENHPLVRVSDKKMKQWELEVLYRVMRTERLCMANFYDYRDYVSTIQSSNPYEINWEMVGRDPPVRDRPRDHGRGYDYLPSLLFWKDLRIPITTFNFAKAFTKGMMLDCKIALPDHLAASLANDTQGWECLGALEPEKVEFGEKEKRTYKEKVARYADEATERRQRIMADIRKERGGWFWWWLTGR